MPRIPRLFSYCLPFDDGAAPNPNGGVCTLAICKPRIRSAARVDDLIVGTGARYARRGTTSQDMSGRLIYAMRVTQKMSMEEYDRYTQAYLPEKTPDLASDDWKRRRGDSIYDFSTGRPVQRPGPHGRGNVNTDLRGKYVLLSREFVYFGANAIPLPEHLLAIAQNRQGHRSTLNQPYLESFVEWIESLGHAAGSVLGEPLMLDTDDLTKRWCANCRAEDDQEDKEDDIEVVREACRR